jgi:hypothetical protein
MSDDRLMDALAGRGPSLDAEFLSIDVDAQLRKMSSRSFRSPHEYPVELVRDALRRGATRVDVRIGRRNVVVGDNGATRDSRQVKKLHRLLNPQLPSWERHTALEELSAAGKLGILAAWAPAPSLVQVYSDGSGWSWSAGEEATQLADCPTRHNLVVIRRRSDGWRKERSELAEACRFSPVKIVLDGKECGVHMGLLHDLIAAPVNPIAGVAGGMVWIPRRGDVCRVHLLEHGVRWKTAAFSASKTGFVFEAAIECAGRLPDEARRNLRGSALRLYFALVNSYEALPSEMRKRVDELIFSHYRATGDNVIVDRFGAFMRLQDRRLLSYRDVKQMVTQGPVSVLKPGERPQRYCIDAAHTLVLTPRQRDFLADEGIPLASPRPRPRTPARLRSWLFDLGARLRKVRGRFGMASSNILPAEQMEPEENLLLEQLEAMVNQQRFILPWALGSEPAGVRLLRGRRGPRVVRRDGGALLLLHRHHPWTRLSVDAVQSDPGNIRMVLPLLTRGHEGWQ